MKRLLPLSIAIVLVVIGYFVVLQKDADEVGDAGSTLPSADDLAPTFAQAPRAPWPHEVGDIPATERATFGALPNGLRYVIMKNPEPPQRVSLRLHIDAGSLDEADDQRGVAHFLEHMVFNGSKNFPDPKQLIPQMQRLGISFGAHANAYTSFDETVYMLDLPNLAEPTLDLAYTVMRDFADGALLEGAEIEKERGVILSEKNSRDDITTRILKQQFEFLIPNSLITHRFPIGIEEVIKGAVRERFTDFYENHYIPQKMTFIVVGDIDVAETEMRIQKAFSPLENPEKIPAAADLGTIPTDTGFRTAIFSDRELASTDISLLQMIPMEPRTDSVALRLEKQPLALAHAILTRRFSILAKKENSPIQGGSGSQGNWFQAMEYGSLDVTAVDGRWEDAVGALEKEYRRALEYGFTEAEVAEIKAIILNAFEQAVKQQDTLSSDAISMQIVASINGLTSFSSPEENLRIARLGLANLTPEACHEAFRKFWDTPNLTLILTISQEEADTQERLLSLYQESRGEPVQPPVELTTANFAYTDFGPTGTIVSENRVEDLDATQLVFENGVRVNFKRTEFEKGAINLLARMGSGQLSMPQDKPGLDTLAGSLLNGGGLGEHSEDELRRILAGLNVGAAFGIGESDLTLSGRTTPDDLTRELQLMSAYLVDPGFREEALRQYRQALPDLYDSLKHDLGGAQAKMAEWLRGGDARYTIPPLEQALGYTIDEAKEWILPQLQESYLELTVVGDFDPEALKKDLAVTFGALPQRADQPREYPEATQMQFPDSPDEKTFTYESKIPRAAAIVVWGIPGVGDNISQVRRLNILSEILGDRMRKEIREELGATYSPSTGSQPSDTFPNFGNLIGFSVAKPEDLEKINEITVQLANDLAEKGADADELERALKPAIFEIEKSQRDNGYWLGTVLSRSQADPKRLTWARERDQDYQDISLEQINALAKEYLTADNAIKLELKPINSDPSSEE